jgi:putative nucleotidyltransferase with HDIG domain
VAQNRTALLALTALKNYDNYTFTHMVNVSILTMGQARGLGIDGAALREFGLAALMHDIGKVKTPNEILNKPGKLTDEEFEILKRHTVDGAEILKSTPEIPPLAPVVAFEHHLRSDGTGYPHGVQRSQLNLGTSLCGIADVYDAMRSQRVYQQAHPSDRILAVLQRNDGKQFNQHLVRRFVQLVGIYPTGNLVKLDNGDIAVVVKPYAPDPYRPRVKVLIRASGQKVERPFDVNLWDAPEGHPQTVRGPIDPATVDLDPLSYL